VDDFLHHLEHLGIYSVLIWQSVLGLWIIARWYAKNVNRSPNIIQQTLPTQIVGGEEQLVTKKGPVGVVDVDVKKQITITDADVSDLTSDEEIKGKVKTQKDKLKQLRRG
jgi:hypothetical protein